MAGGEAVTVDGRALAAALAEWRAEGGSWAELGPGLERQVRSIIAGERERVSLDLADRLLLRIDRAHLLAEICPPARTGRAGYSWAKPHPLRKLSEEQVRAAHLLHIEGGLSLRELGRQLYQRCGYTRPESCTMALIEAFRRVGLPRRSRLEATILASTTHGRAARTSKAAYKRWRREQARLGLLPAWPSDVERKRP